jgi:hypothetical protein
MSIDISGWFNEEILPIIDRDYYNIIAIESILLVLALTLIAYRRLTLKWEWRKFLRNNEQLMHSTNWRKYRRLRKLSS